MTMQKSTCLLVESHARGGLPRALARVVALGLLSFTVLSAQGTAAIATYRFESAGWATFGLALPEGAAKAVKVGAEPTQTDVKVRWPDGSIRFAIVTARIDAPGPQPIAAGEAAAGTFEPTWPMAVVTFTIEGKEWTAVLPTSRPRQPADWLAGPLVVERRTTIAPELNGQAHPFIRVIFDVRGYADGSHRVDVAVENVLDIAAARAVTYDVAMTVDGQAAWSRRGLTHPYLARYRRTFYAGGTPQAVIVPDFTPAVRARAIPAYLPLINPANQSADGPTFDVFGPGTLNPDMRSHGGRPELAPYPDWTARYLAHPRPGQLRFVLAHGDIAGSFPVHLREPESGPHRGLGTGRFVSIDQRNRFWLDPRAPQTERAAGTEGGSVLIGDNAHVPSLAFVPYLVTGDHYYQDEMIFWSNYALLRTVPDAQSGGFVCRGETPTGSLGLLKCNEPRGIAWVLRNMADAAAYLPDAEPAKAYFADKVRHNLKDLDDLVVRDPTPLGTPFHTWMRGKERSDGSRTVGIATWENNYIAWAIDRTNDHGFKGGRALRDALARWQYRLFTSGNDFPPQYAGNSVYAVGTLVDPGQLNGRVKFFTTVAEVFQQNGIAGTKPTPFPGYYGVDARLMLIIGMREGWEGARQAYDYVHGQITADLAVRAGWAIAPPGDERATEARP